jgi:hypothetical protein
MLVAFTATHENKAHVLDFVGIKERIQIRETCVSISILTAARYVLPAISRQPSANKKPTDYLLGACSGRQSVGYRFSLLTLLFSGVIDLI